MNINEILSSDKNKALIWSILYEQNIFNNIPDIHKEKIKILFENTINQYLITNTNSLNDNTEFNITNNNKILLKELHRNILNYKNAIKENNISNLSQETKSEYNNEKLKNFNNDLNNHITSFNTLINNNKPPKDIDFSEKNDEPVDNLNMEALIKQMEKERNSITNTVFTNSNKIDSSNNMQNTKETLKSINFNNFNNDILNNDSLNNDILKDDILKDDSLNNDILKDDILKDDILKDDILNNEIINIIPLSNNSSKIENLEDILNIENIETINFINESKNTNEPKIDINKKLDIIIQKLNLLENLILKKNIINK